MTRSAVATLPRPDLERLADAALRAAAQRHALPAVRAVGLPLWLLREVVLNASASARA